MEDESAFTAVVEEFEDAAGDLAAQRCGTLPAGARNAHAPAIPDYLEDTYWWAYLRPGSVWLFEREWLVNLILWGQMRRLTREVLKELKGLSGEAVLQLACVYGEFSRLLARQLEENGSDLHLLDVAPIQLRNARKKLQDCNNVRFHHQDASDLDFMGNRFARSVLFFLLHEQPETVRRKTIAEAIRVTRPGGKLILVDYHLPSPTHPLRYLMWPVLHYLEPFALDLWRHDLCHFLPPGMDPRRVRSEFFFGGLYQKVVIHC